MKFGDSIVYTRNGESVNALVVADHDGSLTILYLDPAMEQLALQGHSPVAWASDVKPLPSGGKNGYVVNLPDAPPVEPEEKTMVTFHANPVEPTMVTFHANPKPEEPPVEVLDAQSANEKAEEAEK